MAAFKIYREYEDSSSGLISIKFKFHLKNLK